MLRFQILGPVRAWREDDEIDLGNRQTRAVLAMLLANSGRAVYLDDLVDLIWRSAPPVSAANQIYRSIGELRRALEPGLPARATGSWIVGRSGGYVLTADSSSLDLLRFRDLIDQGERAAAAEKSDVAVSLFTDALGLREGPCASGIGDSTRTTAAFVAVDNEYVHAVETGAEIALNSENPGAMLPFLRDIALRDGLNEPVHAYLMSSLTAVGQQAEALKAYHKIRHQLREELGVDPGPELKSTYEKILHAERPEKPGPPSPSREPVPMIRPSQLPPDLETFTGRHEEISRLTSALEGASEVRGGISIAAVFGMAGVGKTTLAVHVAHQLKSIFPDGQLYIDLNGFSATGNPTDPDTALRGLLSSLGIPQSGIPDGLEAKSALYRSFLADRRVLVLLDNARDAQQVKALLPGGPGSAVIVTSRYPLTGLVVNSGAYMISVSPPSHAAAREFLTRRLGTERVDAEPEAVDAIVSHCGRLPLAMAIVAGRASAHPEFSLSIISDELERSKGNLDVFTVDISADTRSCFSWSYKLLSSDGARLFRLLSMRCGIEISAAAAGSLIAVPVSRADALMRELESTGLAVEHRPGHFTAHDLVDAYSRELCLSTDSEETRRTALHRLLEHYLHSALAAQDLLQTHRRPMNAPEVMAGVNPETFRNHGQAISWLSTERETISAAIKRAATSRGSVPAWRLTLAMQQLYHWHGFWQEWADNTRISLQAAESENDLMGQAHTHRSAAGAYFMLKRYAEALEHLEAARSRYAKIESQVEIAYLFGNFAEVYLALGDLATALEFREQELALFRESQNRQAEAQTLGEIGKIERQRGSYEIAAQLISESISISQEIGNIRQEAYGLFELGVLHRKTSQPGKAAESLQGALSLLYRRGFNLLEAEILISLGEVQLEIGDKSVGKTWERAQSVLKTLKIPQSHELRTRLHDLIEQDHDLC